MFGKKAIWMAVLAAAVMTAMHRKQKSDEPQPDGGDKE